MGEPPSRPGVRRTYDRIAPHFSETRAHAWPEVEEFVRAREAATCVIDVGCGNGRHVPVLTRAADVVLGIDFSRALLAEAIEHAGGGRTAWLLGDAVELPVRTDVVDLALYVATLHHVPRRRDRIASLDELARVLAPGGHALVSVWSVSADRFEFDRARDVRLPWILPDGRELRRYYHIYDRAAIRGELDASDLVVDELRESSGNWYASVRAP